MKSRILGLVALAIMAGLWTTPAEAQMQRPEWIEDVNWHANLGTGVAWETGDFNPKDPILLYFSFDLRKSWRWWYGLTLEGEVDSFHGLAGSPFAPYKLSTEWSLGLGPAVFRMELIRAALRTDYHGFTTLGNATGIDVRVDAGTLPTFSGDVPLLDGKHILSYLISPLQIAIGLYDNSVLPGSGSCTADDGGYSCRPYTGGTAAIADRIILTDWAQVHGGLTLFKSWSKFDANQPNKDFRLELDAGAIVGILQNAVQFGLELHWEAWVMPNEPDLRKDQRWQQTADFLLSARLRI